VGGWGMKIVQVCFAPHYCSNILRYVYNIRIIVHDEMMVTVILYNSNKLS
jgi:hypothetical protein